MDDAQISSLIRKVVREIHSERPAAECKLFITQELKTLHDAIVALKHSIENLMNKRLEERLDSLEGAVDDLSRDMKTRKKFTGFFWAGVGFVIMRTMWDLWEVLLQRVMG